MNTITTDLQNYENSFTSYLPLDTHKKRAMPKYLLGLTALALSTSSLWAASSDQQFSFLSGPQAAGQGYMSGVSAEPAAEEGKEFNEQHHLAETRIENDQPYITAEDLKHRRIDADLERMRTAADLERMRTAADLERMRTAADLEWMRTAADLEHRRIDADLERRRGEQRHRENLQDTQGKIVIGMTLIIIPIVVPMVLHRDPISFDTLAKALGTLPALFHRDNGTP